MSEKVRVSGPTHVGVLYSDGSIDEVDPVADIEAALPRADLQAALTGLEDEYTTAGHSYQSIAQDLTLGSAVGSDSDSKYIAAFMGNLLGDAMAKAKPILSAIIGKLSITGTRATSYSVSAVRGEIGDGVSAADGAFVAVLGGDSAQTNARAAYTVDNENSSPGSGFSYGLDLQGSGTHDGYPAVGFLSAPVRLGGDVVFLTGSGLPSDGTTGANVAGPGSMYFRTSTPAVYLNTNTKASPTWKAVTHA